jgi:hypothetical protein
MICALTHGFYLIRHDFDLNTHRLPGGVREFQASSLPTIPKGNVDLSRLLLRRHVTAFLEDGEVRSGDGIGHFAIGLRPGQGVRAAAEHQHGTADAGQSEPSPEQLSKAFIGGEDSTLLRSTIWTIEPTSAASSSRAGGSKVLIQLSAIARRPSRRAKSSSRPRSSRSRSPGAPSAMARQPTAGKPVTLRASHHFERGPPWNGRQ